MKCAAAILFVVALLLAGCGNGEYGHTIDQSQVQQFKDGVSTYDQVVGAMGPPAAVNQMADGSKIVVYSHTKMSVRGATYIPVVGIFAGGTDTSQQSVAFTFDQSGILKNYQTMSSVACSGTGVMSGVSAANCQNR